MSAALLAVAILAALWGIVDMILIAVALDKRGVKVNPLLMRIYSFRYMNQYKAITL